MKVIAQPKALLCRVTGAGCVLHTLTQIALTVLGLLMGVILLLTAPAAMAQTAYVEGEVIVGFRSTADDTQIAAFESRNGLTKLKSFPHIRAANYRIATGQTTKEAITILSEEPIVEYAEPNWIRKHQQSLPTDPKFQEQWYLSNTGQVVNGLAGTSGIDINWLAANNLFSGTQDIVVAVVDTGVALDHPELIEKLWVNPHETLDGIDNDGNGYIDDIFGWDFYDNDNVPLDENNHGTLVASLIAASSGNGEGGVGVSSRVKLMPLRAGNDIGKFSTTAIIDAFTYAGNNGAKIINASFGSSNYSSSEYAIIQWLGTKGVLVVAAAGNGGNDKKGDNNDISPFYPASYPLDNVISVAAVDQQGRLATFSNYGPSSVHIAAPGTNIFGASPTFSTVFYDSFGTGGTGWTQGQLPGSLSPYSWSIYVDGFGRHWLTDSINFWGGTTNYTGYTDSFAQTPLISVGIAQLLSYRIWYQLEYLYDGLIVQASSDGGATWTLIDLVTGFSYSCPSCSIYAGSTRNVDLSSFGFQNKNIYIRFRLVSDGSVNYDGVYLDEITIKQYAPFSYDGTQYQYLNGTSFSAPIVAGVAALIWSQRPDFTYKQVRDVILNSARSLTDLQGKISTGGMVDAYASLQSAIAASPELKPYQPDGWSDKIVVSKITGTNTDSSPLFTTDTLYVDWAVINNSIGTTSARFYSALYVDGVFKQQWYTDPPLNANAWQSVTDFSIGSLSAGTHTIKIVVDSTGAIAESNEGDNEYTKTITVVSQTETISISSSEGTFGTELTITGSGFGIKKGKVLTGSTPLTIIDWADGLIHCRLAKVLAPEVYDVTIQPSGPQGTPSIIEKDVFAVKAAEIHSIEQGKGTAYDQITIKGKFFGTKKGKVYLEYEEEGQIVRKSCKVTKWWMDPITNESEIFFTVPKMLPEVCDLVVDPYGAIPEDEEEEGFTVKPPEIELVGPSSGSVEEQITISGKFFGSKKPKVYLGNMSKGKPTKKSCSIMSWGDEEIVFVVPKLPVGDYNVIVTNSVGSDTLPGGFIIK